MESVRFIRDVLCGGGYHPVRGLLLIIVGILLVGLNFFTQPSGESPATNQPVFLIFGAPLVLLGAMMMTVSRFVRIGERNGERIYQLGNRYFGVTSRVYADEFTGISVGQHSQRTGASMFPLKAHTWIVRLTGGPNGMCDAAGFVSEEHARAFAAELEKE